MTAVWGAALGGLGGLGAWLVAARLWDLRRPSLGARVLPYLRDLPGPGARAKDPARSAAPTSVLMGVVQPWLASTAHLVERALGGGASVQRRLDRAGLDRSVHDFRVEQVQWGVGGFAAVAALQVLRALGGTVDAGGALVTCLLGALAGAVLKDAALSSQVSRREREILLEFPVLAELLALAVAAGEGPVHALDRVVRRSRGALSTDLERVLARIRTGTPVTTALESLAATTGVPLVARFATGLAVAVERGTPLADVLHAQAADVREASRRQLIESAARKEVAMMAPVVFLVLPVTILFAFFPGVIGLRLTMP